MATTKKIKKCCDEEQEEKNRRQMVAAILKNAYSQSDEEKEECISIYAKSLLSIEEIISITEPLRDMSKNAARSKSRIFGSNSRAYSGVS